jgi:hypothetical protein
MTTKDKLVWPKQSQYFAFSSKAVLIVSATKINAMKSLSKPPQVLIFKGEAFLIGPSSEWFCGRPDGLEAHKND